MYKELINNHQDTRPLVVLTTSRDPPPNLTELTWFLCLSFLRLAIQKPRRMFTSFEMRD